MRSFRRQFIKELAMELCGAVGTANKYHQQAFEVILERRLPGALQVMYPVHTIRLED